MATLERLIGELRAGGELDSRGAFTLDRDRALEKMRQFQLTDPRSYVLELVQAAVLSGASEARFEIDADDMRVSFDGRPFKVQDFEELYSSMFIRRQSPARRQLALGLNSAMALDPRVLRVESGTVRMEMRPGGDEITTAADAVYGTQIHVKDRFGNATLVRFVLKLREHITEMLYLKERCRWATLEIYLNGKLISGNEPLAEAAGRVEWSTPGTSIVAGFAHEHRPAQLMILDQGVWIATHQLDHLPFRFVACVESARLLKDASQRDVVRNGAYDEVKTAVSEAFYRALGKLVNEGSSEETLLRWLLFHPATLPLIRRGIASIQESGAETPECRAVAAVPLWPAARQPPMDLSLLDLLHLRVSSGRVVWTGKAYSELERKDQPPVAVITAPEERNYLAELFGDGFTSADSELQHELTRRRNILRWQQRHMPAAIPASAGSLISMPLATPEVKGEVGIFLDPFRQSLGPGKFPVWWIKEGCLLHKAAATPIVRGFTAALEADFEPAEDFASVDADRLLVRVVIEIARALGPLVQRLTTESRPLPGLPELIRGSLISYLGIDWNGDGLAEHLKGFGITDEEHLSYARSLVEENPVTTIDLADLAGDAPPAMAVVPLFETMQERPLTLRDVARGPKNWRYMPKPHTGPTTSAEDRVLLLDDAEIAVLRQVFPGVTLQDHSHEYYHAVGFTRHMRQKPPVPHPGCVEDVLIEDGGNRGRVGLLYPRSPDKPVFAQLQLLKHDRRLDNVRYRLPIGPIAAMINDDELTPTQDWSGVEHDGTVERIRSLVLERVTGLVMDLCGSPLPTKGHRHPLLLNAATRVLATEAALEDWSASDLLPAEVTDQDWAAGLADALETVPLFEDLDGRPIDLRSIREELDRHDRLLYHLEDRAALPAEVRSRAEGRLVLLLSPEDHDALARIFGSYQLSDARHWLQLGRLERSVTVVEPDGRVGLSPEGEGLVEVTLNAKDLTEEYAPPREPAQPGPEIDVDPDRDGPATSGTASSDAPVADVDDGLAQDERQAIAPALLAGPPETEEAAHEPSVSDGIESREESLLWALHAELRHAGRGHVQLLDDKNLDRIALGDPTGDVIASCQAHGVTIDRRQPLVERLLAERETDPVQLAFLASAVYTTMNHFWQEIEDDHEREFHRALVARLVDEQPRSGDARA